MVRVAARAVLLDALGTLVQLQPPAPRLREACARELGIEVDLSCAERAMEAEIAHYRAHLDEGRDPRSLAALRRSCAEVVREALPGLVGVDGSVLTELLLSSLQFAVFEDVVPALERLRGREIRVVVVSNWDISLHDVLTRLDLTRRLDGVLTSAEADARKPAREIFERALSMAGVDSELAIHIGDSVAEDVEGARGAGIKAILLRREGDERPPGVPVIRSLAELWP